MVASIWSDKEIKVLQKYYEQYGSGKCLKYLDKTSKQINGKATKLGLSVCSKRRNEIQRNNGLNQPETSLVNADAFIKCASHEAAYILGFLWADGYLLPPIKKLNQIRLEIVSHDADDIRPIFKTFGKWTESHRIRHKRQPQTLFTTTNKRLYNFLLETDYQNKSIANEQKILDQIDPVYHSSWYHGFFDGDGCFYTHEKRKLFQCSFSGAYEKDWSSTENILNLLKINYQIVKRDSKESASSTVVFSSQQAYVKWGEYIYSHGLIGLQRKYNKYIIGKKIINEKINYS